jgi:predicted nuclease of restriction endonuclease-like (RecB) superfamily
LLAELSKYLNGRFGKGFSESTLKNTRKFYKVYAPSIRQTLFAELRDGKQQTLFAESEDENRRSLISVLESPQKGQTLSALFKVSWSHYLILMRIDNPDARSFYEIEAAKEQWSFKYLSKQVGSSLYERLALSRDKDGVMRLAKEGQTISKPQDILKNPFSLEFLGLEESEKYSESDLETAIISKLQKFMLELGKGFLFEARQKRFTFNEQHFRVDLVLYNRLLRSYVLIDLKTGKLEHQDLGQMQMYVHYFDRYVKTEDEHPTVGILLCREKNDAVVELTLPEGENIYAAEYSLYLPDKALLQRKLAEWVEEFEEAQAAIEARDAFGGDAE